MVPRTLPIVPMDPFAALFAHATPRARTFFTGTLCKTMQYPDVGHLHFLNDGKLTLVQTSQSDLQVDEPTLLFFRVVGSIVSSSIRSAAPISFARPSNSAALRATRSGRDCPSSWSCRSRRIPRWRPSAI